MPTSDWFKSSIELHNAGDYDAADRALDEGLARSPAQHIAPVAPYSFRREPWEDGDGRLPEWGAVNLLNYARRQPVGARQVFAQYYAQSVGAISPAGQRDPQDRIKYLPEELYRGATILDIGGNSGGMLHELGHQLRWGVGTDYDARLVNAANRIACTGRHQHLHFYVHDLEEDPLDLLVDFMPEPRADVVLLLAVCAHLKNWREVIGYMPRLGNHLVFEANGAEHEQLGQLRALWRAYDVVEVLAERGAPGIGARRLLLCRAG